MVEQSTLLVRSDIRMKPHWGGRAQRNLGVSGTHCAQGATKKGGEGTSLEDLTRGYKLCVADERDPGCDSGADAQSVQEAPRAAETNKNERQPAQSRS